MGDPRLSGFATRPAGSVDSGELADRIFAAVRFLEVLRGEVAHLQLAAANVDDVRIAVELGAALRDLRTVDAALRRADRLAKP